MNKTLKNILPILLTMFFILGLNSPVIVKAATNEVEVSTTMATVVEAEDHPDCAKATKSGAEVTATTRIDEDGNASGGKYLFSSNYDQSQSSRTHYWEYKFTVSKSGLYTIKTRVGKPWKWRFHGLTVTFGETQIANITTQTSGDAVEWGEYTTDLTLTVGTTYSFKVKTTSGTGGNHHLYLDYVSVSPKNLSDPEVEENQKVTVDSTETTTIEAENNKTVTDYTKTTSLKTGDVIETTERHAVNTDVGATVIKHNNIRNNISGVCEYYQTVTWTVPIEITYEGDYELEYCANQSAHYHGNIFAVLDGTDIAQLQSVNTGTPQLTTYQTTQHLTAGTHYISVIAKRAWNMNCNLVVDYVSLTPAFVIEPETPTVRVGSTGITIIEAEDYPTTFVRNNRKITSYDATVKNDISTTSGGQYIFRNAGGSIEGAEHYWEITLDIPRDGNYEITSTVPTLSRYRFHSVKIMIGSYELYSESSNWPAYNSDVAEFTDNTVEQYLEAGIYKYRFYAGKGTGGNQQLNFDAVKIKPIIPIAENGRYEYENYAGKNSIVSEAEGASGGKVACGYTKEEHKYQIPVKIEKSGYYDISYVVHKKTDAYTHSKINFSLNLESDFPLPISNDIPEEKELEYTSNANYTLCLYKYQNIWIDEDEYILETKFDKVLDGYYKYQLDYIEITPSKAPEITQSSVSKIELDSFAGVGVYDWDRGVTEAVGTSGGKAVVDSWSDIDPSWSLPVKVKDSGFYHINYAVGNKNQTWFSKITFKLGNVTLGTNVGNFIEDCGYLLWESQPLCKFRSEWIWLDKGEYELSVLVDPDEINNVYKYQTDYIEFVPAVNGISMEDGVVKVHAAYTDVTSGKVLMALYNGSKLVGTTTYNLSDETYVDFEYIPEETITKVKVFIWNDDNTAKPKEMSKDFDLIEN